MWHIRIRETFVCIGIRKTLITLTTLFSSGTKLLLLSLLLGFQREERETQFLICWQFHLTPSRTAHLVDPTRLASPRFENQLASSRFKSQLTAFFQKSPKILSPSLLGMTSFTTPVHNLPGVFIMTSVLVTSSPREREHLRSMYAPTRALSRTVLSLTKPKDKIKATSSNPSRDWLHFT